jgi:hypothetical protein
MSDYRAIAEKRAAEFKEEIKPVEDRGTPEERAAAVAKALAGWRSAPAPHPVEDALDARV